MKSYQMIAVINQLERDKEKLMVERDTYRDLCVELLAALKNTCALVDKMGPKSRAQADSAITKAEAIMGEKS